MKYLLSAFSLQMLPDGGRLEVKRVGPLKENLTRIVGVEIRGGHSSYGGGTAYYSPNWDRAVIGHAGTAQALAELLGSAFPVSRDSVKFLPGDLAWVVQPAGRLEVGAEVAQPSLTLFEVRVLGEPGPPRANLALAATECLFAEVFRREEMDLTAVKAAKARVEASF